MNDEAFTEIEAEVELFTLHGAGRLRPDIAHALLAEARRARDNEKVLIARLRATGQASRFAVQEADR
jgi:hypothetical protein